MKTNGYGLWAGALVVFASTSVAGAAEPVLDVGADPVGVWARMGLWVALVAVLLLGVGLAWLLRFRSKTQTSRSETVATSATGSAEAAMPRSYSPVNVGNDASARPWERSGPGLDAGTAAGSQGGVIIESGRSAGLAPDVPADFDVDGFLVASKANFVALQDAWNRSDTASLRAMMTDGMLELIKQQLAEREQVGAAKTPTEVVMLDAHLLGVEAHGAELVASVEFSGMLREDPTAGPNPFREVWSITRPKADGGGWLVAGVQALQ